MAVYVDDMQMPADVGPCSGEWSHLMADSVEELLVFGAKIGMRRRWLQVKRSGVHFDVTEPRRRRAIQLGAVPIGYRSAQWRGVVAIARSQYRDALGMGVGSPSSGGLPTGEESR